MSSYPRSLDLNGMRSSVRIRAFTVSVNSKVRNPSKLTQSGEQDSFALSQRVAGAEHRREGMPPP